PRRPATQTLTPGFEFTGRRHGEGVVTFFPSRPGPYTPYPDPRTHTEKHHALGTPAIPRGRPGADVRACRVRAGEEAGHHQAAHPRVPGQDCPEGRGERTAGQR